MKLKLIILTVFLILENFLCINVLCQGVIFKATGPDSVIRGSKFAVKYSINQNVEKINTDFTSNFELISGPEVSLMSNVEYRNGEKTISYTNEFSYTLKAKYTGTLSIFPAFVIINNQKAHSNLLNIKIYDVVPIKNYLDYEDEEVDTAINDAIFGDAPEVASVGDVIEINYEANQQVSNIKLNLPSNFELIRAPENSSSRSISIVNGKLTEKNVYKTTYYIRSNCTGTFTIPKAYVIKDKKKLYSNECKIKIINTENSKQSDFKNDSIDLFLKLKLSKEEVYEQESVLATYKISSNNNIISVGTFSPEYNNTIYYNVSDSSIKLIIDTINHKKYLSALIFKTLLFPQSPGKLNFDKEKLECVLGIKAKQKSKNFFDDFFAPQTIELKKTIESNSATILVKPFPPNPPSDFIHICGTDIKTFVNKNDTTEKLNDTFSLEFFISGNGNLKMAPFPNLNLPPELKIINKKSENFLHNSYRGTSGYRKFIFTLSSKKSGIYRIPSYSISYFDLNQNKYVSVNTEPFLINVKSNSLPLPKVSVIERKGEYDLMLVIDISGTMIAQDIKPDRLKALTTATKNFLKQPFGNIGLVVFRAGSETKCPLTSNMKTVSDSLDGIKYSKLEDGTSLGLGLSNAILELKDCKEKFKNIILVTDGINNNGTIDINMATNFAKIYGIRIFTVGIGGRDSLAPYPLTNKVLLEDSVQTDSINLTDTSSSSLLNTPKKYRIDTVMTDMPIKLDEKTLKQVAWSTGGKYYRADKASSLNWIYADIKKTILSSPNTQKIVKDLTKEEAERILNVITQDLEEIGKPK